MKRLGVWMVLVASVTAQTDVPYYGEVTGDRVRLRGGPGDAHAIVGELGTGAPVHALERVGRWIRVEIPGGFPVFISTGRKDKDYLRQTEPGEAVVLVTDLLVRPAPSGEYQPLGRLHTGDRVVVFDGDDNYTRVLSPSGLKTFIYDEYVSPLEDQEVAAAAYAERHLASRRALLETGELSRQLLAREDKRKAIEEMERGALAAYEEQRQKAWDERDTSGVRVALVRLKEELPAEHPGRTRAESMLLTLDEWDRAGAELTAAKVRFAQAAGEARDAETRYAQSLRELRERLEREAKEAAAPASPYIATGRIGKTMPAERLVSPQPTFSLMLGDRRAFYLTSTRYDLADYVGKLVGVLEAQGPQDRLGLGAQVYEVRRLEILQRGSE